MTTTLQAVFDGKVLVPNGPVDLPIGQTVELQVVTPVVISEKNAMQLLAEKWAGEPIDDPSLPVDFSTQVDHYLYGTPRRDEA